MYMICTCLCMCTCIFVSIYIYIYIYVYMYLHIVFIRYLYLYLHIVLSLSLSLYIYIYIYMYIYIYIDIFLVAFKDVLVGLLLASFDGRQPRDTSSNVSKVSVAPTSLGDAMDEVDETVVVLDLCLLRYDGVLLRPLVQLRPSFVF